MTEPEDRRDVHLVRCPQKRGKVRVVPRQVDEILAAAVDKKELPAMEPGAMCYMMSKQGYAGDSVEHWPAHLMFFYSQTDLATWGAGLPDSPILGLSDAREHLTTFAIAVQRW